MIHALRMTWSGLPEDKSPYREPIIAWGISFPRPTTAEQTVEYVVNSTWLNFNMKLETDDEAEEEIAGDDV